MKNCKICKLNKPLREFYNTRSSKDGHQLLCKKCDDIRRKKLSQINTEKYHPNPLGLIEKKCNTCQQILNVIYFGAYKMVKDGFHSSCKKCRNKREADRRGKNYAREKPVLAQKQCTYCNEIKPIQEFNKQSYTTDGYSFRCRICNTVGKFNLTIHDYKALLEQQNYACKICKTAFDESNMIGPRRMTMPCVDHCHAENKVRGLLCNFCNTGLGMFKDNIKSLKAAIEYLTK